MTNKICARPNLIYRIGDILEERYIPPEHLYLFIDADGTDCPDEFPELKAMLMKGYGDKLPDLRNTQPLGMVDKEGGKS